MLPSVLNSKPPALSSEEAYAKIIEDNMKAMKNARLAFIKSESSERIKRAISDNIQASGNVKYVNGDRVFYKRKDETDWHGPGTVIGQDGQFVLVRNQSSWVRVHPTRLRLIPPSEITYEIEQENTVNGTGIERRELNNNNVPEDLTPTMFQDDVENLKSFKGKTTKKTEDGEIIKTNNGAKIMNLTEGRPDKVLYKAKKETEIEDTDEIHMSEDFKVYFKEKIKKANLKPDVKGPLVTHGFKDVNNCTKDPLLRKSNQCNIM